MSKEPIKQKYDLEDRLIRFSKSIIQLTGSLKRSGGDKILSEQLRRSGISSALNYGEAMVAESRKDFIHKMSICLKELKESRVALKIIYSLNPSPDLKLIEYCENECSELVAIFIKSIATARKNGLITRSKI